MPDKLRRRIQSNATFVADGLEKLQEDLLELFDSQLDKYRDEALEREDIAKAYLITMVNEIGQVKRELTSLTSGIRALAMQLSEYESIIPGDVRRLIAEQVKRHEIRLNKLDGGGDDGATTTTEREEDGLTDSSSHGETTEVTINGC